MKRLTASATARFPRRMLLACALAALGAVPLRAEVGVGLFGGAIWPGGQDITAREHGAEGVLLAEATDRDLRGSPGGFIALAATGWTPARRALGARLVLMAWEADFELKQTAALTNRNTVEESFQAGFLFVLGRLPLDQRGAFLYAGPGGGVAYERIKGGARDRARAFGLLVGIAYPVGRRLRGQLEVAYLVCSDLRAGEGSGIRLETSGTQSASSGRSLFGPHWDKRFLPITIGLEWRL